MTKKIKNIKNDESLFKICQCDWCGRKRMMSKKLTTEYFQGYYCADCYWVVECANEAAEKDRT